MTEFRVKAWLASLLAALGSYFLGSLAGFIIGPELGLLLISSAALLGSFAAVTTVYATAPRWRESAAITASAIILLLSWLTYGNTTYGVDPSSWILWREWHLPRPIDGAAIGCVSSAFIVGVLWLAGARSRGRERDASVDLTGMPTSASSRLMGLRPLGKVVFCFLARSLNVSLVVIGGMGLGHYIGIAVTGNLISWHLALPSFLSAFLGMSAAYIAAPESRRLVPSAVFLLIAAFAVSGHGLGPHHLYAFDQTLSVAYYLDRPFIFFFAGSRCVFGDGRASIAKAGKINRRLRLAVRSSRQPNRFAIGAANSLTS